MSLIEDLDHPGLYLISGPGLTEDLDHPGLYLITGFGLTEDLDHPGLYLIASWPPGSLIPDPVAGSTLVDARIARRFALATDTIQGDTWVDVAISPPSSPDVFEFLPDPVLGSTAVDVRITSSFVLAVDTARGVTLVDVAMNSQGVRQFLPDPVLGATAVRVIHIPALSRNTPILLAFSASMRLESVEPLVST